MDINNLKFNEKGLIPAIIQDYKSGQVLMMAFMNEESILKTIETKKTCFYSRSREKLWTKGETSGHFQYVKDIRYDCDEDCLLILVEQIGPACHTNNYSCFYRSFEEKELSETIEFANDKAKVLQEVFEVILDRRENPKEGSYTNYLFEKGIDKILKKVGEESAETIIAAKNNEKSEIQYETADLFYHLLVMLADRGLEPNDIYKELEKRK